MHPVWTDSTEYLWKTPKEVGVFFVLCSFCDSCCVLCDFTLSGTLHWGSAILWKRSKKKEEENHLIPFWDVMIKDANSRQTIFPLSFYFLVNAVNWENFLPLCNSSIPHLPPPHSFFNIFPFTFALITYILKFSAFTFNFWTYVNSFHDTFCRSH